MSQRLVKIISDYVDLVVVCCDVRGSKDGGGSVIMHRRRLIKTIG